MFKPYSVRKGIVVFDEQVLTMNFETKKATIAVLKELYLSQDTYDKVNEYLLKYYPTNLQDNTYTNFFNGFSELDNATDINTFIEIVLVAYNELQLLSYRYRNIETVIDSLNEVFAYRKYMYTVELTNLQMYPYSDEVTSNEVKEIFSHGDEISGNISEALKKYMKKPGNSVHEAVKALEYFFINEMNCTGKTLKPLIKDFKAKPKYVSLSQEYKDILNMILARIMKLRNDGLDSGHPGNTTIEPVEARMTILMIVNIINAFRMKQNV